MKFPDRFWIETAPRLTDVALAALLASILRRAVKLPGGVLRARTADFEETRFGWAAAQIALEIGAAPGVTLDATTGLAVVWDVAVADLPRGPGPGRGAGRLIGQTQSSWTRELAKRLGSQLTGTVAAAFLAGLQETMEIRGLPPRRPRPHTDSFEPMLTAAKRHEHTLRAGFDGVEDRGTRPSMKDRAVFVQALGSGLSGEDILIALDGRAEKCRRSRMWRAIDTAEQFLRLDWLCERRDRLDEAMRAAPAADVSDTTIVRGPGGTFIGGREWFNAPGTPTPAPAAAGLGLPNPELDEWMAATFGKK